MNIFCHHVHQPWLDYKTLRFTKKSLCFFVPSCLSGGFSSSAVSVVQQNTINLIESDGSPLQEAGGCEGIYFENIFCHQVSKTLRFTKFSRVTLCLCDFVASFATNRVFKVKHYLIKPIRERWLAPLGGCGGRNCATLCNFKS